jgi:hypothetical protein
MSGARAKVVARVASVLLAVACALSQAAAQTDSGFGRLEHPGLLVDKVNRTLAVLDADSVVKTYPVDLGRDPVTRKLHQDNATTPEGVYRITSLRPSSTFHKAYDLSYPNEVDRQRYRLLCPRGRPGIGGEIQIHGNGCGTDWTYGCIALRNEDIDELFEHPEIGVNTKVVIVGKELTREDIMAIERPRTRAEVQEIQRLLGRAGFGVRGEAGVLGPRTRSALGRFQKAHRLPVTCDLDTRTLAALGPTGVQ